MLAMRGQLPLDAVRERCGDCALHYLAVREGCWGPLPWAWALIYDSFRWTSWHLQMRLRKRTQPGACHGL